MSIALEGLNIALAEEKLTHTQRRILRSLNALMLQVATTEDESTYFEASAELLIFASVLIKQGAFAQARDDETLAYSHQAIEYAFERVIELFEKGKSEHYDN